MQNNNIKSIFSSTLNNYYDTNKSDTFKRDNNGLIIFSFKEPELLKETVQFLSPLADVRPVDENNAFVILKDANQAASLLVDLKKINMEIRRKLLISEFKSGWLEEYLEHENLGMTVINASELRQTPETIKSVVKSNIEKIKKREEVENEKKEVNNKICNYSMNNFVGDLGMLIFANWKGFNSPKEAKLFALNAIVAMEKATKNACFFDADNDKINKLYYLIDKKDDDVRTLSSDASLFANYSIEKNNLRHSIEKLLEFNSVHGLHKECKEALAELFSSRNLELKEGQFPIDLKQLGLHGKDFIGDDLIMPAEVKHQSFFNVDKDFLMNSVASYYMKIMTTKKEALFTQGLIDISNQLDKTPFLDAVPQLFKKVKEFTLKEDKSGSELSL